MAPSDVTPDSTQRRNSPAPQEKLVGLGLCLFPILGSDCRATVVTRLANQGDKHEQVATDTF